MLDVTAATEFLRVATGIERLAQLAVALGFATRRSQLSAQIRSDLDLPAEIARAAVTPGVGALRCLLLELTGDVSIRGLLARTATVLATRAPYSLWLIIGCSKNGAHVVLAAWVNSRGGPQLRALLVDRHHIRASDVDTICAMASAARGADLLIHTRWTEILGRDALTRRFYASLRHCVATLASSLPTSISRQEKHEIALLNVSRLLFLSFLQVRGWLDGDHAFLENAFYSCCDAGGGFHARILEPLFFGTLNTRPSARQARACQFGCIPYLNGGLFARASVERRRRRARFDDASIAVLFAELLSRYRFTPREDLAEWSEAAVDPEILGRAFEALMEGSHRKSSGTYYTPLALVERATRVALVPALASENIREELIGAVLDGHPPPPEVVQELLKRVQTLRVLDPACGSGAFLVHVLRVLADLRVRFGREEPMDARRAVLSSSLFGLDINPTAVWLCELRLWLALAVECASNDPAAVPPLPNLDKNIRVGDALKGGGFASSSVPLRRYTHVARLRARYSRAQGQRKRTLGRLLDRIERESAVAAVSARILAVENRRRDVLAALRSRDLFGNRAVAPVRTAELRNWKSEIRSLRSKRDELLAGGALPFAFATHFSDIATNGGFDVIVGNPPWVRPHHLDRTLRDGLRRDFRVLRDTSGSAAIGTMRIGGFGSQIDLAALFVEQSLSLARAGGIVSLLVPAKLWRSLAGASLRRLLSHTAELVAVEDFTAARNVFDAAVYPSLVAAARLSDAVPNGDTAIVLHRRNGAVAWRASPRQLGFGGDAVAPWLLVPPNVRTAFERLRSAGLALQESVFGFPRLGVKTGCNEAFIVDVVSAKGKLTEVRSGERRGWIESACLRPALRGELVERWRPRRIRAEHVIWTHDARDRPLQELPARTHEWLWQWRRELVARVDAKSAHQWWRLFRTPAAATNKHRVVWCDIGRRPRACVLEPGDITVPLNTCYVVFAEETAAWALAALLNGPLIDAWLNVLAEPARGGYHRYMAWTVSLMPVPSAAKLAEVLAPIGIRARGGATISDAELLEAALVAYRLKKSDIAPLLEWRDV